MLSVQGLLQHAAQSICEGNSSKRMKRAPSMHDACQQEHSRSYLAYNKKGCPMLPCQLCGQTLSRLQTKSHNPARPDVTTAVVGPWEGQYSHKLITAPVSCFLLVGTRYLSF